MRFPDSSESAKNCYLHKILMYPLGNVVKWYSVWNWRATCFSWSTLITLGLNRWPVVFRKSAHAATPKRSLILLCFILIPRCGGHLSYFTPHPLGSTRPAETCKSCAIMDSIKENCPAHCVCGFSMRLKGPAVASGAPKSDPSPGSKRPALLDPYGPCCWLLSKLR